MSKIKKLVHIFTLISVYATSSCTRIKYEGVGSDILSPIVNVFSITAEKSGTPFNTENETINVGEKITLYFKDKNNSTDNETVAATWRLQGGIGNIIINSDGISAVYVATSIGTARVYAEYNGISKYVNISVKSIAPPKDISLGTTPNSLTSTPKVNWSEFSGYKVQASVYLASDNSKILDWTDINNDSDLAVLLNKFSTYYIRLRGVDEAGNFSTTIKTNTWIAAENVSSTTFTRPEVTNIKDIDYGRSKYWIIPNGGSLNNDLRVKSSLSLSTTFNDDVLLRFPQSLLGHNGEIYIFDQEKVWRGDGATSNNGTGDSYMSFKASISDGYIFTGGSTGTNQGNRYYIYNLSSLAFVKDIRDFEPGNGRGISVRPFKGELFFSGSTNNNASNPIRVHKGNNASPTGVTSLIFEDVGHVADDNSYESVIMEEIDEEVLLAAVNDHNRYSYTTDGVTWSPKYFGASERIRGIVSDDSSFFVLIQNSSDSSEYIYRIFKDDLDTPVLSYSLSSFNSLERIKVVNDDLYIVGNSSGQGYIEVIRNLFNRPSGI